MEFPLALTAFLSLTIFLMVPIKISEDIFHLNVVLNPNLISLFLIIVLKEFLYP